MVVVGKIAYALSVVVCLGLTAVWLISIFGV
jgi:hypothetical protein